MFPHQRKACHNHVKRETCHRIERLGSIGDHLASSIARQHKDSSVKAIRVLACPTGSVLTHNIMISYFNTLTSQLDGIDAKLT